MINLSLESQADYVHREVTITMVQLVAQVEKQVEIILVVMDGDNNEAIKTLTVRNH